MQLSAEEDCLNLQRSKMKTLYDKIGGRPNIELMVTAFYQRVLGDALLAPFFEGKDIEKLKRMQVAFFSIALGGGAPEQMPSLSQAHAGLGIQVKHLTRFTELLIETLGEVGIAEGDAQKVYERIATYTNEVLGDANVDG
jgi:hemoglobin